MVRRHKKPARIGLCIAAAIWMMIIVPLSASAAPYAAMVIDARTGKTLHSENADTRLHPASLTKMMTLYVVFEAVEAGEISLDKKVRISRAAASEPPSKLGLREGQRVALRHLIRAAAIKSANDAATALGEAIEGSEAAFARRMNRTAKALGMTRTTFKNAHGLTEKGHLSTARDMTILGRHLFYDYPDYYHLFSRITHKAANKNVRNTNRKFLRNYKGADGIKTGYTRAAGFNLVASAQQNQERVIVTVFGGKSTKTRNAQVAKLMDLGFREAPSKARVSKPTKPTYAQAGIITRQHMAPKTSLRPKARPILGNTGDNLANQNLQKYVQKALEEAQNQSDKNPDVKLAVLEPKPRPGDTSQSTQGAAEIREIVTRISAQSGQSDWAINIGRFASRFAAEKMLLRTALSEMATLQGTQRKIMIQKSGYDANFVGLTREGADLACRKLQARNINCLMIGPS
jgi:D-alanyl-D-alanine carboxypeptidase